MKDENIKITEIDKKNLNHLLDFVKDRGVKKVSINKIMKMDKDVISDKINDESIYTDTEFVEKYINAINKIIGHNSNTNSENKSEQESIFKINPFFVMGLSKDILYHNYSDNFDCISSLISIRNENKMLSGANIIEIKINDFEYFKKLLENHLLGEKSKTILKSYNYNQEETENQKKFVVYREDQIKIVKENYDKKNREIASELYTLESKNKELKAECRKLESYIKELKHCERCDVDDFGNVYIDKLPVLIFDEENLSEIYKKEY